MATADTQLLLSATLQNLEIIGVPENGKFLVRNHYFAQIFVDDRKEIESHIKSRSSNSALKWEWDAKHPFWFEPSSTIKIELYRSFKYHILKKLAAKHEGKVVDFLADDSTSVALKDQQGQELPHMQAKLMISRVSEPESEIGQFMDKVDADVAGLDSENRVMKAISVLGPVLQATKKLLDSLDPKHTAPPVLGIAFSIFSALYEAVKDKELQDKSIRDLAATLREMLGTANRVPDLLKVPDTVNVIEEIGRRSLQVASLIQEYTRLSSPGRTIVIQISSDLKSRIEDCQKACTSLKDKFNTRLAMDTNVVAKSTYQLVYENYEEHLVKKVQDWLSPPDSSRRRNEAHEQWLEGTCSWFFEDEQFVTWKQKPGFLLVQGKAGSGKSVLCSSIINHLSEQSSSAQTAHFFFDGRDSQTDLQLYHKLIRSLIFQLSFKHDPKLPLPLVDLYKRYQTQQPLDSELENVLVAIISCSPAVYIIIDALDECRPSDKAWERLQKLFISETKAINAHVLVTSRPLPNAAHDSSILDIVKIDIGKSPTNQDISNFIQQKLNSQSTKYDKDIQNEIQLALAKDPDGSFRWATLQLAEIEACSNNTDIRKKLGKLPRGLVETYQRIIQLMDEDHLSDTKIFLQFLAFAKRPISVMELAEAITVDLDTKDGPVFDQERRYHNPYDVLQRCSSLVTESQGEIKLSHFSVREFLLHQDTKFEITEEGSHSAIMKTSLGYLMQFDSKPEEKTTMVHSAPLAGYAARYWTEHAYSKSTQGATEENTAICRFFTTQIAFLNWIELWDIDKEEWEQDYSSDQPANPSAFYYACLIGIKHLVLFLAEDGAHISTQGGRYGNPLQAASARGHEAIVKLLLGKGADINAQGGKYGNALQAASATGREAIVKLLLEKGADINAQGGKYGNALQAASATGREAIVKLLLEKGADINAQGGEYGNALQTASYWGYEAIVKLLLEKGADINAQGGKYGNALQAASAEGYEAIANLLLEKGADINYGNALREASYMGHEAIVKLLLEKGADINYGNFALREASHMGHEAVVKLLLEKGADINYGNALREASYMGHEAIVKLLLEKGADINYGNFALREASHMGHEAVVKLLLEKGADINYGNALQGASYMGHEAIVKLLLAKGADINAQGGEYGNALQTASYWGYEAIVKLLLEKGADINAQGGKYGNALQAASAEGYEAIANLLLEKGADINAQGGEHGNALQAASARGHKAIVKLLLEKGADINARGGKYGNPLQAASFWGCQAIVKLLLEKGADINAQGGKYGNALQAASYWDQEAIVKLLLEKGADINAQGGEYGNALQAASARGHKAIVNLLLEKGAEANTQEDKYE